MYHDLWGMKFWIILFQKVDAFRVEWASLSETSSEIHVKILFHIIAKHTLENYSLYMLFELKFSGKTSEEKYAASLGTKAKQIFFLDICDYFKKNMSKAQRCNITYRAYGKRSQWGSYKNNNSKCKISLKRVYIYKSRTRCFRRFITYTILFWST